MCIEKINAKIWSILCLIIYYQRYNGFQSAKRYSFILKFKIYILYNTIIRIHLYRTFSQRLKKIKKHCASMQSINKHGRLTSKTRNSE